MSECQPKTSILAIKPYKPGESKISGSGEVLKLSANENPLGCSPAVQNYNFNATEFQRYPDGDSTELKQKLAKQFLLRPEQLICGAGSDEIFNMIMTAFTDTGDEIIHTEHGFLMYKLYALAAGAVPVAVRETNLTCDIENILAAVTAKTKIVFIANPNNPTGSYISAEQLEELRQKLPSNILLVIDGAYAEYVVETDYESGINLAKKYTNVIATRTFSKIYGLAALRVGYAVADPQIIDYLNRVRSPFNVNKLGQEIAELAIEDQDFIKESREFNLKAIAEFSEFFSNLGVTYQDTVANFILINLKTAQQATEFCDFLARHSIIVRPVAAYALPEWVRISFGDAAANKKLKEAISKYYG